MVFFCRSPLPSVDRTTKPPAYDHFMSTGSSSGNKFGLRDVIIPSDLPRKFLVKAEHNTLKNIETCGILAGKLVSTVNSEINVCIYYYESLINGKYVTSYLCYCYSFVEIITGFISIGN